MRKFWKENAPFWGPQIDPFWGPKDAPVLGAVFHGIIFKKEYEPWGGPQNGSVCRPRNGGVFLKFLRILMHFFAGFPACLLLRMLYSYMPADWNWRMACVGRPSITIQRPRAGAAQWRPLNRSALGLFFGTKFSCGDGQVSWFTGGHFRKRSGLSSDCRRERCHLIRPCPPLKIQPPKAAVLAPVLAPVLSNHTYRAQNGGQNWSQNWVPNLGPKLQPISQTFSIFFGHAANLCPLWGCPRLATLAFLRTSLLANAWKSLRNWLQLWAQVWDPILAPVLAPVLSNHTYRAQNGGQNWSQNWVLNLGPKLQPISQTFSIFFGHAANLCPLWGCPRLATLAFFCARPCLRSATADHFKLPVAWGGQPSQNASKDVRKKMRNSQDAGNPIAGKDLLHARKMPEKVFEIGCNFGPRFETQFWLQFWRPFFQIILIGPKTGAKTGPKTGPQTWAQNCNQFCKLFQYFSGMQQIFARYGVARVLHLSHFFAHVLACECLKRVLRISHFFAHVLACVLRRLTTSSYR